MNDRAFSTRVQDSLINAVRKQRIPVTCFMKNGQIFKGKVESFDQYTIKLETKIMKNPNARPVITLIYKSCLLTIVPMKKVELD